MKINKITKLATVATLLLGATGVSGQAQAQDLTPPETSGSRYDISSTPSGDPLQPGGVKLTIRDNVAGNVGGILPIDITDIDEINDYCVGPNLDGSKIGQCQATFDFFQPMGPTNGIYEVDLVTGDFADGGFLGTQGYVNDLTVIFGVPRLKPFAPNQVLSPSNLPVNPFLELDPVALGGDGDDFFELTKLFGPAVDEGVSGTTFELDIAGRFYNNNTGYSANGVGLFTSQFAGFTEAEVLTMAATADGIQSTFSNANIVNVPEPGTMLGLLGVAGAGFLAKRKKES